MNVDSVMSNGLALGATWVLWLLVGLSVLAVAILLERSIFFLRTRGNVATLETPLSAGAELDDFAVLKQRLLTDTSFEACVLCAGMRARSVKEAEERMLAATQTQRLNHERCLAFLGTLGNNAPFVGLLGTVLGIAGAFRALDVARGELTSGLMATVGETLGATALGLIVALPAVAAYNAFQRAIQVRMARADALGRLLIAHLHAAEQRGSRNSEVTAIEPLRAIAAGNG